MALRAAALLSRSRHTVGVAGAVQRASQQLSPQAAAVSRLIQDVRRRNFHVSGVVRAPEAKVETVKVKVNGKEYDVPKGASVLQACEVAGVYVPRFCYHDKLSIAGNCRMCLVEVEKAPKPVASCAYPIMPNMHIKTDTPLVHKAREGVMEFLLINHPLDCPICDQGGECDLQDQSMAYGSDRGRFREWKRGVEDKNLGPLVKTTMTRCIQCTRCVRFSNEIAGVPVLGTTNRGNGMEIGTYVEKFFDSEMSGNVIDLCPVGALTSKPYAFTARPWELSAVESIDVLDAAGASIRIDTRGTEIMRILPRLNDEVNEEWISDKARFSYDGLKRQRLDTPMIKKGEDFQLATWEQAFTVIKHALQNVSGDEMLAVAGDLVDAEALIATKDFFNRMGSDNLTTSFEGEEQLNTDVRTNYLFNSTIAGIEDADVVVLVGTNPRMESPLICSRLRKSVRQFNQKVFNIGAPVDLALKHEHLGNSAGLIQEIASGSHKVSEVLSKAKKPMIIVGTAVLQRPDAAALLSSIKGLSKTFPNLKTDDWNGINLLHTAAARVAAHDLGFRSGVKPLPASPKFVFLLGADEYDLSKIPEDAFVVYQGHHGDAGANRAHVILPATAYTEKMGTYVNLEGRVQHAYPATTALSMARDDWKIVRALSEVMGKSLPYDSIDDVRKRLVDVAPHFASLNSIEQPLSLDTAPVTIGGQEGSVHASAAFKPLWDNFYMTNPISRSSRIMAKASQRLPVSRNSFIREGRVEAHQGSAQAAQQQHA